MRLKDNRMFVDVQLICWIHFTALDAVCTENSDCSDVGNAYCLQGKCACGPLYEGVSCAAKSKYLKHVEKNTYAVFKSTYRHTKVFQLWTNVLTTIPKQIFFSYQALQIHLQKFQAFNKRSIVPTFIACSLHFVRWKCMYK